MEKFQQLTAVAAPILRANIDTDAIIPSREMKSAAKTGLADGLFAGWRYTSIGSRDPDATFVLNDPKYREARILLAGENFGCGSSREHAVWALRDFGFRAIIAPSFSPIFYGNCIRNGIVPVRLPVDIVQALATGVATDPRNNLVRVDLDRQEVVAHGVSHRFEIDPHARAMLLSGQDEIDLTLSRHADIETFLQTDRQRRPWIYLV